MNKQMGRKCILATCIIMTASSVSLQAEQSQDKFQPDDKFLNSVIILREGILDLGEMKVKEYVELISTAGRSDGTAADIKGWTKEGNTYKLQADIGELVIIEFDFKGTVSQLQPVKTKRTTISPEVFTMQLMQNVRTAKINEGQKKAATITAEIKTLDAKQREQLASLAQDGNNSNSIKFVRMDIEAWKQEQTALTNRQKDIQNKIGPVLSKRVELEISFDEKIKSLESAKIEFYQFKEKTLAAGVKLINDAIIAKNLEIDMLPRDGIFHIDPLLLYGKIEDAGSTEQVEYRFTIFANSTEESLVEKNKIFLKFHRYDAKADRTIVSMPQSGSMLQIGNEMRGFYHFPRQINDESVKMAFAKLYGEFNDRIRRDAGADAAHELPSGIMFKKDDGSLKHQRDLALEKFDYKNEAQVEDYQKILSQFKKEMAELRQITKQQAYVTAKIVRKEAILNTPRGELQQALRKEIKQIFVEKRKSLETQLEKIAELLKD